MNTKFSPLILLATSVLLLGIVVFSARSVGQAQGVPSVTPLAPGPVWADVTMSGQIVPVPNSAPDSHWLFRIPSGEGTLQYGQPVEYHLYDMSGHDVKLAFGANLSYLGYNALWQDWAGRWVVVLGHWAQPDVLQVAWLDKSGEITGDLATRRMNTLQVSTAVRPEQVTFIAQVTYSAQNPQVPRTGLITNYFYHINDINGTPRTVDIWEMPDFNSRMQDTSGEESGLRILSGQWAKFTGWVFKPSLFATSENLEVIELQSVHALASPPLTVTAHP